jgi:hypothetical protein
MKRIFFKIGMVLELALLTGHLYVLRNGLPIPDIDKDSHELIRLLQTYKIHMFDTEHTLKQTLTGYDYSWGAFVLFAFVAGIIILAIPLNSRKAKSFTLATALLWVTIFVIAYLNWGVPQQILLGSLSFVFLLSYFFDWRAPVPNVAKVCVVGAGLSGLTAAFQLQKKGYTNVTVIEKESRVGGKCLSHLAEHRPYDIAGHEMLAGYYDLVQIAEEVGAPTQTSINPLVYDRDQKKYLNFKEAATQSGYSMLQVMWAAMRYLYIVGIEFRNYSKPNTGFANMPKELAVDLDTWLARRKLMPLSSILGFVIKAQGYGGYNKSTAAYLVKFMGFKNWSSLLIANMGLSKKWPRIFSQGAQNFCDRVAATLQDVRLNANITRIERNNAELQNGVKVFLEGESEPLLFDWLIVSSPLTLSSLGFLHLNKEDPEYPLFEKINTINVCMSLCEVQGLPAGVVAWLPLTSQNLADGEPTGYIRDFGDRPFALFLALLKDDKTGEQILEIIEQQLEKIPPYMGVQPKMVRKVVQKKWKYFPHVEDQTAIANGIYDKLEKLQGQKQTYYVGSSLSFECMGNCAGYSKKVVEDHF